MNPARIEKIQFFFELARLAGKIMRSHWGKSVEVFKKDDLSLVTEVDLAISEQIVGLIRNTYPDLGLITEETWRPGRKLKSAGFVVDELDGTVSFIKGRNGFTFQIAYYEEEQDLLGSLIYDPLDRVAIYAWKNEGAWIKEGKSKPRKLDRPAPRPWEELRFAHHRTYISDTQRRMYEKMNVNPENIIPTGSIGSKAFEFARGKVDCLVALHRRIMPWDWAPGSTILRELGFRVTHFDGQPVSLRDIRDGARFGYLACPPEHLEKMVKELAWIMKKLYRHQEDGK